MSFDKLKNILLVLLLITVVALVLSHCHQSVPTNSSSTSGAAHPIAEQYTDQDGTVHTENKVAQIAGISEINQFYQHIIDSLVKKIGTRSSRVADVSSLEINTGGSFVPDYSYDTTHRLHIYTDTPAAQPSLQDSLTKIYSGWQLYSSAHRDTVRPVRIHYADQWITIDGSLHKDSALHYSMYDAISVVGYEKKTGWFSSAYYVDVSTLNPHSRISGLTGVRIKTKPKSWGIGISTGYVFDGYHLRPGIGIGITKTLIRW